ncbi:RNA-binding protein 48 isoform 2-T2 [Cochliomyia hominivorax]
MNLSIEHHKQYEYCTTRLKYRQGRELKAVKTYTVANESQNLLIFGVPKINLIQELKQKLSRFAYGFERITMDHKGLQVPVLGYSALRILTPTLPNLT